MPGYNTAMFTKGFQKTAGFWSNAGQAIKKGYGLMTGSTVANAAVKPGTAAVKRATGPLARRVDGSAVTTEWGLKQGVKSGAIRYGDVN